MSFWPILWSWSLEPLTHNELTIKDSFSFAKDITTYDSSLYMASLDVESLFTNIPLNETINNCVSDLHNKNLYNGKLSKRDLFKLLETATSNHLSFLITCFTNMHFDAIMKKKWLDNCPIHFRPVIYKRYVDDIFVLFSSNTPNFL